MPRRPRTALLVEDEALLAFAVEVALGRAGYAVCGVAATEADALRLADERRPDFAVVDLRLTADGDGLSVGRALAAGGTAVLYASAFRPEDEGAMRAAGGLACLAKPYDPEDVPFALDALEKLRRGQAPLRLPRTFRAFR